MPRDGVIGTLETCPTPYGTPLACQMKMDGTLVAMKTRPDSAASVEKGRACNERDLTHDPVGDGGNMQNRAVLILVCLTLIFSPRSATPAADQPGRPRPIRIAVYDDLGASSKIVSLLAVLGEYPDFHVDRIKAEAIRVGRLKGYDVLIQ